MAASICDQPPKINYNYMTLNKTYLFLTFGLLILATKLAAQTYPKIDKNVLYEIIEKDNTNKFFTVFIFTNGCQGGFYINNLQGKLDSITNGKTKFILAQASRGNDRTDDLEKAISTFKLNKNDLYLIDETKYKITKKDSREQGMLFRDDICFECKYMVIGTVYKLIFDKNKNLLYHGFAGNINQLAAILSCK
jgi:hypothetical protein